MSREPGATELDTFSETPRSPSSDERDNQIHQGDLDSIWTTSRRPLISGLLGMNVFLLGAALVTGQAFNPNGLKKAEPQIFIVLLMGGSLIWMLWYLLWARNQPGNSPHTDHHAGGITVIVGLVIFAAVSLLVFIFRIGYLMHVKDCTPAAQTYLLWAHSKDCIQKHKLITRSGLMVILSADLLLWLNAVTEDTMHEEIELEKAKNAALNITAVNEEGNSDFEGNSTTCGCSDSATCLVFRKGFEVLYPFNIEYYLMAGCMVYVMWKNVARRVTPDHHHGTDKVTLRMIYEGGIFGLVFGAMVLIAGVTILVLYQVWVIREELRLVAFFLFYGYHIAVMPLMSLCCLAGIVVHMLEKRVHQDGHNPTRKLDVVLLVAAAIGQLALSYFSLVAAAAGTATELMGNLDLSYSLLTLLEIILQNIFIIEGLHRHPEQLAKNKLRKLLKFRKKRVQEEKVTEDTLLDGNMTAPPAVQENREKKLWSKRAIQEICAFLIFCNIMLWIIPAFGVHPQFENGVGKQFFGFTAWFVMVNLGQPLSVFYRMHSVGALMELYITE
ncbi:proton channel OTOP3 isoform X2 [Anabas testudineus]|uniref:proton channel OTOP3 isoform X2 n=1 Tax=Anabas testudineus TaxID=64144 RepID=UPI000E463570|nr:proton channel OTOP3 isoform X2 [Anabas testudineus]